MSLTREEVAHLAHLVRLALCQDEQERFVDELKPVLEYVAKLSELKTTSQNVTTAEPVALRTDSVMNFPDPSELVTLSPGHHDGLVAVPAVFGSGDTPE